MSKQRVNELIEALIKSKKGYGFDHWARNLSTPDIVHVYTSVYGSEDTIQMNNAKNLAYAFSAYATYSEENSEIDYVVFLRHIIDLQ
jgi:hypothetical protein